MIGRYVGRVRGRALKAAGVPRTPNLPSARALAQRELRTAATLGVRRPTRRAGSSADVPAPNRRTDQPRCGCGPSEDDPYRDPSRDLGEGPDELTRGQAVVVGIGVLLALYLLFHPGAPDPAPDRPTDHCHLTCEE